jgi:hypothetical protein
MMTPTSGLEAVLRFAIFGFFPEIPAKRRSIGTKKPKERAVLRLVNHSLGTLNAFLNAYPYLFPARMADPQ